MPTPERRVDGVQYLSASPQTSTALERCRLVQLLCRFSTAGLHSIPQLMLAHLAKLLNPVRQQRESSPNLWIPRQLDDLARLGSAPSIVQQSPRESCTMSHHVLQLACLYDHHVVLHVGALLRCKPAEGCFVESPLRLHL